MNESQQSSFFDLIAGGFVLILAGIFLMYSYSVFDGGEGYFHEEYRIFANFSQVDGLKKGADVRLSGIKVGRVVKQTLHQDYRVRVEMVIDKTISLSTDTIARIISLGLFGDLYIALEPGGEETHLKEGEEIIYTKGSVDMIGLFLRSLLMGSDDDKKNP